MTLIDYLKESPEGTVIRKTEEGWTISCPPLGVDEIKAYEIQTALYNFFVILEEEVDGKL